MKPFNLEAAKSGAPIVTRDGREARFIAHVPEFDEEYRVIVQISDRQNAVSFCENGRLYAGAEDKDDLFMKPQKRTKYVNLYEHDYRSGWSLYSTEEEARKYTGQTLGVRYHAIAVPVEIEE